MKHFFRIKLINCGLIQKPSTGIHFRVKKRKCVRSSEWKEWDSSYNRHYLRVCGLMSAHAQRCCCTSWGAAVFGVGSSVRHGRDAGHERATLPRQPRSVERLLWEEIYLCMCVCVRVCPRQVWNTLCASLRLWCISAIWIYHNIKVLSLNIWQ